MLIAGGSAITLAFVLAAMPAPIPFFLFAMVAAVDYISAKVRALL